MNAFVDAATAFLALLAPLGAIAVARRPIDGLVAVELAGGISVLAFLTLAEGFHRSSYFSVAVVAAAVTFLGGIVFARFLGRWL